MIVNLIIVHRYEVYGTGQPVATLDLLNNDYNYIKFQLSHLSCIHITMIVRFQNLLDYYQWVGKYYFIEFWKVTHMERINPLEDLSK